MFKVQISSIKYFCYKNNQIKFNEYMLIIDICNKKNEN